MRYRRIASVQRRVERKGKAGQVEYVDDGLPIPVRGNLYPLTTDEVQFYGDRGTDTRKWFCQVWPGDMHSRITLDGAEWDQVEPAKTFDAGVRSRHVEVILRKR